MNKIRFYLNLLLMVVLFDSSAGQTLTGSKSNVDSLLNLFKAEKHDPTRIQLLLNIGDLFEFELPDSCLYYYKNALLLADSVLIASHQVKPEILLTTIELKSNALRYTGIVYEEQGSYDKAMEYYLASLKIFQELTQIKEVEGKTGISSCYINMGVAYQAQGIYDKALEYYLKSLKIGEELNNLKTIADCYLNIGLIHSEQGSYEKALDYYLESLKISEKIASVHPNDGKKRMSKAYNNIGIAYDAMGNPDQAKVYYEKSLKIYEALGDKMGMSQCINNIGTLEAIAGNYDMAMAYFLKSLKIDIELGDKNGMALDYGNIGELHVLLADSSSGAMRGFHLRAALENDLQAISIANEINALPWINSSAKNLMNVLKKLGNFKKAIDYADIYIATNDSMFKEEKTKSLADAEAKFKTEKKQLEIDKLNKEKELQQSEILRQEEKSQRQKIVILFVIIGLVMITVFAVFVFQRLQITRKQKLIIEQQKEIVEEKNTLLHQQNEEIKTQRDEIEAQRDEIEAQRDMVTIQRDHIEKQKKEITDSINYAQRIQHAVLQSGEPNEQLLGEHFVLFKPKAIVSGDFYWATRLNEYLIFAVADCTGHGVPGAFMSMLGISFLNEIIRKKEIAIAGDVLNLLRESIIQALQQKGASREQKDGLDMAVCVLNLHDNTVQFAGAHNPLYLIRNADRVLTEIKGDNMTVAFDETMKPFSNHLIKLQKGDILYLMSDGYEDQFGGPKRKKFLAAQLKDLLLRNFDQPMAEQKTFLETTFENWKGSQDQIDDVTILGLKI